MNIFDELSKKNINKAVVYFNGGDDDGGVSGIRYFYEDGSAIDLNDTDNLYEKLSEPIYDKYGSFAGEFYVSGDLIYDVKKRKIVWGNEDYESRFEENYYG